MNQRANVISCVTVHDSQDSDSSTCSPLSPKRLPNFAESSGQGSKSLAVVMPSLKAQTWEGVTSGTSSLHSNLDKTLSNPDKTILFMFTFSWFLVCVSEQSSTTSSGKSKKTSALQSSRSGLYSGERHQRTVTTKSQPLNLSQVEKKPFIVTLKFFSLHVPAC